VVPIMKTVVVSQAIRQFEKLVIPGVEKLLHSDKEPLPIVVVLPLLNAATGALLTRTPAGVAIFFGFGCLEQIAMHHASSMKR